MKEILEIAPEVRALRVAAGVPACRVGVCVAAGVPACCIRRSETAGTEACRYTLKGGSETLPYL